MKYKIFGGIFVGIHTITLILLAYLIILAAMTSSIQALSYHLKRAGTFVYASQIVQKKIEANLPQAIDDRIILRALTIRLIENVITPEFIEKVSVPILTAYTERVVANSTIQGSNVVLDTSKTKSRIDAEIAASGLPDILKPIAQNLANAVPPEVKLVDLQERPNSILAKSIQAREMRQKLDSYKNMALTVAILSLIAAVITFLIKPSEQKIGQLLVFLGIGYVVAGLVVWVLTLLLPSFIQGSVNVSADPLVGTEVNLMVQDILIYIVGLTKSFATGYIIIGVILFIFFFVFLLLRRRKVFTKLQKGTLSFLDHERAALANAIKPKKKS